MILTRARIDYESINRILNVNLLAQVFDRDYSFSQRYRKSFTFRHFSAYGFFIDCHRLGEGLVLNMHIFFID